jgi:hypothetical protein
MSPFTPTRVRALLYRLVIAALAKTRFELTSKSITLNKFTSILKSMLAHFGKRLVGGGAARLD